jgi:hypothetical protein
MAQKTIYWGNLSIGVASLLLQLGKIRKPMFLRGSTISRFVKMPAVKSYPKKQLASAFEKRIASGFKQIL